MFIYFDHILFLSQLLPDPSYPISYSLSSPLLSFPFRNKKNLKKQKTKIRINIQ